MTNIKHHLTDEVLLAYSAGTLPEAFDLVVATHVSLCDECRARLDALDAVGGAVLEDCAQVAMSADSLSATLAMIADAPSEQAPHVAAKGAVFPAPLQEYVSGDLDAVKWRSVGGGVRQAILKTSNDASVRLLRIPGGAKMPDHGHRGMEMTLVLQGAFKDEDDRFARGDVEIANEDLHHTPVAEEGVDCICLAATDAPLKFNAFIPRIAQPFLRI
ncbi:MAG: ChrR family anti-sigma-E factor [Pseudomonadota bacterium]